MRRDRVVELIGRYYQQYGTDLNLAYPSDGIGGWKTARLPLNVDRTALVIMHAFYGGEAEAYPEQFQRVEYLERCYQIARHVYPALLAAVREAGMRIYHVPFGSGYYEEFPGYQRAEKLAEEYRPVRDRAVQDPVAEKLYAFKADHALGDGEGSRFRIAKTVAASNAAGGFLLEAMPVGEEGIATGERQLAALATADEVNHLIYIGFALDGCLLTAAGGMMDMLRRGFLCSTVADAVTAIECRESGRDQGHLQTGLWRVGSSGGGMVYESAELIRALKQPNQLNSYK